MYRVQVVDLMNVRVICFASPARLVVIKAPSSVGQRGKQQQLVVQHHARVA